MLVKYRKMKQQILLISFFSAFISWGQMPYKPLPETNAAWIQADFLYSAYNGHEHATVTSVVYTLEDTLIQGNSYRKFGSHGIADWIDNFGSQQNQTSGTDYIPTSFGYFRQDSAAKKVFLWNDATQSDDLLYDFENLVIGQPYPATVSNVNYPNLLVMAEDSVFLLDGNYYRRWVLGTNASDSAYVSVIEGVGGTNGFNNLIYPQFEQSSNLQCHRSNTQSICENWLSVLMAPHYSADCSSTLSMEDYEQVDISFYPNPTTDLLNITSSKAIQSIEVYDTRGVLILNKTVQQATSIQLDCSTLENGSYYLKIGALDQSYCLQSFQVIK